MSFAPIGQVLSHYSVVEQIGAGGMGVVYRAHDARLDRDVALKVLPPAALNDERARKRFRHEALALAKLNHPNIASIYDFDTDNGIDFLVMEFVDGTTLSTKLATAHLCEADVVTIGEQIAKGLGAAHEAGLVHCDLKPGNIILTAKQQVKLLDFGLARLFRTNEDAITESLSEQHAVAGTLPYMAPEQLRCRHADARTDLYALGAVLYEMATGQRPFPQRNAELVDAILNRPPAAPTTLNRQLTPGLEALILRALNKDPGDRYQTAQQLWTDLTLPHNSTTMGMAIRRNRAGWKRWALTGSLVLALLAAITQRTKINHLVSGKDSFPHQRQLAVLPFRNLDGNTDQAFVQGLADNISIKLSELSHSHPLDVVPASEVHTSHVTSSDEARKELGVNLVLDGSIQRISGLVRVNISLVDTNSHRLLRAETITVNYSDPFKLEDQIVQTAVRMLQLELHQNEQKLLASHGTLNLRAYDLYTRGRGYLQDSEHPEDVESAMNQFQEAINLDSAYAAAYAGLGEAYWAKYQLSKDPQWVTKISEACEHSIELEPALSDGNICLGTLYNGLGKFQAAASQFQLAVNSDPANDAGYRGLASAYEQMGSLTEAEQTYRRAIQAKPRHSQSYTSLGAFYAREARYADAALQFEKAVNISPENAGYWSSLGGIYLVSGNNDEALRALRKSIEIRPSFEAYSNLGQTYFALRRFGDAVDAFEQSVALGGHQVQAYGNLARAYYWFPPKRHLAHATFLKAIELADEDLKVNPNDADAHTLAAEYSAMIGNSGNAVRHLDAALHLRPQDPETLFFAGVVYNLINQQGKAIFWLGKSISAGYSRADIASTLELASLRTDPRFIGLLKDASKN